MKIVTREIEEGDILFCDHCNKDRKVILAYDDQELREPNIVICAVCHETIGVIEKV